MLLAGGRVVTVSADAHADLFAVLRGGGLSAYGVVLELCFRTIPLPGIRAGSVRFPLADAVRVLTTVHALLDEATPDTVTLAAVLDAGGLSLDLCGHHGDRRDLDRLRAHVGGDWGAVRDRPYLDWQSAFDGIFLPPMRGYWKSIHFDRLDVDPGRLVAAAAAAPDGRCSVLVEYYNPGTLDRYAAGSAFPLRGSRLGVLFSARWPDAAGDDVHRRWARAGAAGLGPGTGAYANYAQEPIARTPLAGAAGRRPGAGGRLRPGPPVRPGTPGCPHRAGHGG